MTVGGSPVDSNINTTASATVQEKVALYAWKALDASITLKDVDIPAVPSGTERIYVASKATAIAGGMWHYEFAVYNQNCDQCVGSFSVPCPANATVTNIGFRDVAYRDGDGIGNANTDGTDWTGSFSNGAVSWNTAQTFQANANGNAIRWGTQYNFRFDANVAPTSANMTLKTWKTGAPYRPTPCPSMSTARSRRPSLPPATPTATRASWFPA
jgi:hypothetical protein